MKKLLLALAVLVYSPAVSAQGMVTSADPRGIGGGGFLVHNDGKTGKMDTVDGRETAPAAATPQRFLDETGKPLPFGRAFQGGKSIGVPGNIRLMALTHKKWGKLPWKTLFAPAIKLAEDGYQVSKPLNDRIAGMARIWDKFPDIAKQYTVDGQVPAVGTTMKNPALAAILRRIADEGPEAFYAGDNARAIVAAATGTTVNTSDITLADLTAYQAKERAPVCGTYRIYKICGMAPPSSGAVTVIQILDLLERFDLKKLGPNSPVAWHLIGEAMELAYADREKYLGDSDFVQVPLKGLIDPAYLAARSKLISTTATLPAYEAGTPPGAQARTAAVQNEVHGTTHFIAIDKAGDIAAMTSTVEGPFGSQLMANGYILNNELTDFTFAPEKDGAPVANRVEPGKRPLSSMAPTIVYDAKGKPIFTVGAAGGKTIIMQVAKALIAHLDWGMNAKDSIGQGLIYFSGRTLILEKGTSLEAMKAPLEKLGHQVVISSLGLKANAAERTAKGWVGAADPRSVGTALSE
jgi:gamma-glutamyltranspeptidase/glutathione hydrolase